ncbi:MAG: Bug family tripartite tricarboxylate transporter substrate binding protein [Burkholderiales bacterium]
MPSFARHAGLFVLAVTLVLPCAAVAQVYPQRPVRLIVGLPPGGSTDLMARMLAARLTERWGQQVVVDNRPGASGIIGIDLVVKAQPDGYTLLMGAGSFSSISSLYSKLPFDTTRDLAPVALIGTSPYLFVVHPSLPVRSMSEFIAYAKANPGKITYAGSTPGAVQHLSGELLKRTAGIDMLYVPYKGTGVMFPDLLSGRLQAAIDNVLVLTPHIKSGALRALAVTAAKRTPVLPDVPTISESGVPGFNTGGWFGVFTAVQTPPALVARMNAEMAAVMQQPEVRERLVAQGVEPLSGPPDDLRALVARESATWGKLIREAGLKAD